MTTIVHFTESPTSRETLCGLPWAGAPPFDPAATYGPCDTCARRDAERVDRLEAERFDRLDADDEFAIPGEPLEPKRGPLAQAFYLVGVAFGWVVGRVMPK